MSWLDNKAFVKILGAGKGREEMEVAQRDICSRWDDRREVIFAISRFPSFWVAECVASELSSPVLMWDALK